MPLHSDFAKMRNSMRKQYGEKKGDSVFWGYINKNKLDETKPMPNKKKEASLIPTSWVAYMASIKQEEYMPPSTIEAPYKPKKEDFAPLPTKWEDFMNKVHETRQSSYGGKPGAKITTDTTSTTSGNTTTTITKEVNTMPPITKGEQPFQPEMAKKYNKSLERAEEGPSKAGKMTPTGKGVFMPWYAKNRPYGPPRSPDQDRMASDMSNALTEVTAIWNEIDTGKKSEEKKEKVGKFLEDNKDFLKRPMRK